MSRKSARYTEQTIIIVDLTVLGMIHVHTRKRLSEEQLQRLNEIAGIKKVYPGQYMTGISAFARNVAVGRAFSFEELAPQIFNVFIDALGLSLDTVEVYIEDSAGCEEPSAWIVDAARKLRHHPTPRNPLCPLAATIDDVKPGVELITYDTLTGCVEFITPNSSPTENLFGTRVVSGTTDGTDGVVGSIHLASLGVVGYEGSLTVWNLRRFSVVNTPKNRKLFVGWLSRQKKVVATSAAAAIMTKYPSEFVTTVFEAYGLGHIRAVTKQNS